MVRIDDEGERPAFLAAVAAQEEGDAGNLLGRQVAGSACVRDIDDLGEGMDMGVGELVGHTAHFIRCDLAARYNCYDSMQPGNLDVDRHPLLREPKIWIASRPFRIRPRLGSNWGR